MRTFLIIGIAVIVFIKSAVISASVADDNMTNFIIFALLILICF